MAEYIQGYDEERFASKVDPNFLCLICRCVLKDPVLCPKNHHCFCRVCIGKHLRHSKKCPTCSDELNEEALTEPQNALKRILNGLDIRCVYIDRGCQEIVQLEHLERHETSCGFMPVVCSNEGCDVTVNKRDLIHHQSEVCEFRKVKCHSCEEMSRTLAEMKRRMERMEKNLAVMEGNAAKNLKNIENSERNVATKVVDMERKVAANMKTMEKNLTVMGKTNMASMRKNVSNVKQNVAASMRIMERKLAASMKDVATEVSDIGKKVAANLKNVESNVATKVSDMEKTVATNLKKLEKNMATKASENTEKNVTRLDTTSAIIDDILVKVNKMQENQRKRRRTGSGDREDSVDRSSEIFNRRPEKYRKK